jgi:hypothetical protein
MEWGKIIKQKQSLAEDFSMSATSEPHYQTVWPQGKKAYRGRKLQARVPDLSGKVIGELWDFLFRGEDMFPILREELQKRFPGIRFVTYDVFGNVHGPKQLELVGRMPELLEQYKVDAVISGIGA